MKRGRWAGPGGGVVELLAVLVVGALASCSSPEPREDAWPETPVAAGGGEARSGPALEAPAGEVEAAGPAPRERVPSKDGAGGERSAHGGGAESEPREAVVPAVRTEPAVAPAALIRPVEPRRECTVPRTPNPRRRGEYLGLTYARPGGQSVRLDLVKPSTPGPHAVVLLIHGGGWRGGRREHMLGPARALAKLGYAAATIDYRLSRGNRGAFPAAVSDARCAVRWLRHNAGRFQLDADRIVSIGMSAGGHLSAMLAVASDVTGLDDGCDLAGVSPRVAGAVAYFSPLDLRDRAPMVPGTERIVEKFLEVDPADEPARATLASPIAHVDPRDPPLLLVHSADDAVVRVDQSRLMYRALTRAGVPVTYVELPTARHGVPLLTRQPHTRLATCTTLAFLETLLGTGGH